MIKITIEAEFPVSKEELEKYPNVPVRMKEVYSQLVPTLDTKKLIAVVNQIELIEDNRVTISKS